MDRIADDLCRETDRIADPHTQKQLLLVRVAGGMHDQKSDKSPFDDELTFEGWQQVAHLRKYISQSGLLVTIGLVVVSPMSRALQTAVGIFGFDSTSTATSNVGSDKDQPPIIAHELCRERLGKYECDKRRSTSQYRSRFPAVDFSLVYDQIENEDDVLWEPNERERLDEVSARAVKFIKCLWERKEEVIAVVSHGEFLQQARKELGVNSNDDPTSRFKNGEMRTITIIHPTPLRTEEFENPTPFDLNFDGAQLAEAINNLDFPMPIVLSYNYGPPNPAQIPPNPAPFDLIFDGPQLAKVINNLDFPMPIELSYNYGPPNPAQRPPNLTPFDLIFDGPQLAEAIDNLDIPMPIPLSLDFGPPNPAQRPPKPNAQVRCSVKDEG